MSYPPTYQENGTSWDAFPIHLPGGEAMARTVGGIFSFITDAHKCCCEPSIADRCPTCTEVAHCPDPLYVYMAAYRSTGVGLDCTDTYTLTLEPPEGDPDNIAHWEGTGGENNLCWVILRCVSPPSGTRWEIVVHAYSGLEWWLYCVWDGPTITSLSSPECPMGVYHFSSSPPDEPYMVCSDEVVVYS